MYTVYAFTSSFSLLAISHYALQHSIAAVGKDRKHASYSSTGAAVFVAAPGGDDESYVKNIVAKPGGGCWDGGAETSFASLVVAGVAALVLQANPDLTWRDVQGILATISQKFNEDDPSWSTNAAGNAHSYKYGFGMIDAIAAVAAAQTWEFFTPEVQHIVQSGPINLAIPDYLSDPVSSMISLEADGTFEVESVVMYLDLSHSSRGNLEVVLVSPGGTESILSPGCTLKAHRLTSAGSL